MGFAVWPDPKARLGLYVIIVVQLVRYELRLLMVMMRMQFLL